MKPETFNLLWGRIEIDADGNMTIVVDDYELPSVSVDIYKEDAAKLAEILRGVFPQEDYIETQAGGTAKLLASLAQAQTDYLMMYGVVPTHAVMTRDTYGRMVEEVNPPVHYDAALTQVLGMELLIVDGEAVDGEFILMRRP